MDAHVDWTPGEKKIFRRRPPLRVSQWAEQNRVITRGSLRGPWRNENAPYTVKPMDTWQLPHVQEITLRWAPQTSKTQSALNCLMYAIDYDPDAALYIMPDEKNARRISRRQIKPAFKSTPVVAGLMSPRKDDTTALAIQFINGMDLGLAWATSAAALASESYRYLFFDEPEKYPPIAGREGDPIYLGEIRTTAYPHTKKIFYFSTPNEEKGSIMRCEKSADEQWVYMACCPICGHHQQMVFDRIVWPKDTDWRVLLRRKKARYQCENCGMDWDDHTRDVAVLKSYRDTPEPIEHDGGTLHQGWFCPDPVRRPRSVAFHLPSWYSRFVSMSDCAADFIRGQEDPEKLKIFVTQRKAEPWKQIVMKTEQGEILHARVDLPAQTVPAGAVALSCGIDVQKLGFWFVVRAWAVDFTSWLLHYGFLPAWSDVENLLFATSYPIQDSDRRLPIWRAAIDTGGGKKYKNMSMTEETYWWIRKNGIGRGARVWGTKGSSRPLAGKIHTAKPLDKTPSGKPLPGGLQIITLDTDKNKDMVHYRLQQAAARGAYAAYLNADTGMDYARQLTAEEKQRDKKGVETWVQLRKDNHLLDCECLAHIVVDPEWPGGGLNLLQKRPGTRPAASKRKVISRGIGH
jgi:phage terminase large subunit GpA-like protein